MNNQNTEVTESLISRYLKLTHMAREKATPVHDKGTNESKNLEIMMEMADSYASDAKWFVGQGDFVRAFGAINYAHAWIDCAVKIGLLDGHGDDDMFTLP
ncbi:MAG: DUF357 domain-containing protein [Candidatus Thalassarchaeaceae archaeon]|nr:DUF357 domain-containing protein [Candidatus Thalassarchaeaceae archaeon]